MTLKRNEQIVKIIIGIILISPFIVATITSLPFDIFEWEGEVDTAELNFVDNYIIYVSMLGSLIMGFYLIIKSVDNLNRLKE